MLTKKFFGQNHIKLPTGTTGLYVQDTTVNTKLYTFGTDVVTAGTSLLAAASNSAGVGIPQFAIIARGGTTAYKYTYSGNLVTATGNLTVGSSGAGGAGNSTFGIVGINPSSPNNVTKYTYAGDVITPATALQFPEQGGFSKQAYGNSAFGIFASNGSLSHPLRRYTYASDVISNTAATFFGNVGPATYIDTLSIVLVNGTPTTARKYMYASDTFTPTTSLSGIGASRGCGAGSDTIGVFPNQSTTNASSIYVYSNDTTHDATSFGVAVGLATATASNGLTGVNI